jgi:hypothetical protein
VGRTVTRTKLPASSGLLVDHGFVVPDGLPCGALFNHRGKLARAASRSYHDAGVEWRKRRESVLSSGSRNRIANESEAGGPARDVYAVAKETPSAESHPDVAEVAKGVLKSGKRCSILASEFAIHT